MNSFLTENVFVEQAGGEDQVKTGLPSGQDSGAPKVAEAGDRQVT